MSASAVLTLWSTSIGKKVVMAVTGFVLVGYVVLHMAGNLKIFFGEQPYNAYASFLREMGAPLLLREQGLWMVRAVLVAAAVLHVWAAAELTRQSYAARPVGYRRREDVQATYAARTMRWSGVILLLFVVYHVLHFTAGAVGYAPGQFQPGSVYRNVVAGFGVWYVSAFYILAQLALGLHMYHGMWSMCQTVGLGARTNPGYRVLAAVVAAVVVGGNISIPVAVLAGWVR